MGEERYMDRDLYRQIKRMNQKELEATLKNMYRLGFEAALNEATVDLDTEHLRLEIGKIKGIGESRLNEIMAIIEKAISDKSADVQEEQ